MSQTRSSPIVLAVAFLLLGLPSLNSQEPSKALRTWHDATGKHSTEATFGGMKDSVVTLHKVDGATVKIELYKLSAADRTWILSLSEETPKEKLPKEEPKVGTAHGRANKWYEGGTLHKKSALDWQRAGDADKLATCADIVAAMWDKGQFKSDIQKSIKSVDDMKPYAKALVEFLDTATKRFPDDGKNRQIYTNQTVTDMSIIGMLMMGWAKK